MIRMVTPNTNVTAGSIDTTFLKDKGVTGDKINTTGALDNQVLSYDVATDTVIWQDVSQLDNTFEAGITVGGAQSFFNADVQINADLEINGDLDVSGALTGVDSITSDTSFTLTVTNSGNLTLTPDGFIHADADNMYVGSFSQAVHITPTTIGSIGSALTVTGNLTGDVTGNLTGDVTGDVDANDVKVNPDSFDPSGWTVFGGFDIHNSAPLTSSKSGGSAFSIARRQTSNSFGFVESLILERDYDFSGDTIDNDIMATNTNFIATPGGGARRSSSTWTRLRDITVAGTDGTDCEYDEYDAHFELVAYKKASGSNEVAYSVVDASSDRTQIMNTLEVVARQPDSGNADLSALQFRYEGSEQGTPDAYMALKDNNAGTTIDMIRFGVDGFGTYKTEYKARTLYEQDVEMLQDVSVTGQITASTDSRHRIGDLQIDRNTISLATESEVEFDSDFNVTGDTYFGSGSGTQITSSGEINTYGSSQAVVFGNTIQLDLKAADPTGVTGMMYFNTATKKFRGYDGDDWVDLN